jgi:Tetracyclin repressor-like, C-terminal domain
LPEGVGDALGGGEVFEMAGVADQDPSGSNGFIQGGIAYTAFALTHPWHFEVMFRPDLHRADDPELVEARAAAFAILYGSACTSLDAAPDEEVSGVVVTGWSMAHGLAALARTGNLRGRISDDPSQLATQIAQGVVRLTHLAGRYLETHTAAMESAVKPRNPRHPGSRVRRGARQSRKVPSRMTHRCTRLDHASSTTQLPQRAASGVATPGIRQNLISPIFSGPELYCTTADCIQ